MPLSKEIFQDNIFQDSIKVCEHSQADDGAQRINIDGDQVGKGLSQLVLTLIKLLHELLERQAIHRMEAGQLNDEEIESLGTALMQQAEEIEQLRKLFGLREKDLTLDLGPLGKLV